MLAPGTCTNRAFTCTPCQTTQLLPPRWGYKHYRPDGATNITAPLGLQTLPPRWGYKHYRPAGATNIIAPLGLQTLSPRWGYKCWRPDGAVVDGAIHF
jgi:hypothetical protein